MSRTASIKSYDFRCDSDCIIGEGAFGRFYATRRVGTTDGRKLAIKIARNDRLIHKREVNRELNTFKMLTDKPHPNCQTLVDSFEYYEHMFFVTEHCELGDMGQFVAAHRPRVEVRFALLAQISNGLCHMHGLRIVHRDMKPGLMLVTGDPLHPTVRISGFSVAKVPEVNEMMGKIMGTMLYMAPELFMNTRYNSRVDIFPFGLMCLAMLQVERTDFQLIPLKGNTSNGEAIGRWMAAYYYETRDREPENLLGLETMVESEDILEYILRLIIVGTLKLCSCERKNAKEVFELTERAEAYRAARRWRSVQSSDEEEEETGEVDEENEVEESEEGLEEDEVEEIEEGLEEDEVEENEEGLEEDEEGGEERVVEEDEEGAGDEEEFTEEEPAELEPEEHELGRLSDPDLADGTV